MPPKTLPTSVEIAAAIYGAWRLARFDESGIAFLGASPASAARSFLAPALLAPLWVVALLWYNLPYITLPVLLLEAVGYVIAWTAVPAMLTWLLPFIGRGEKTFAAMTAYNWAMLLVAPALSVPGILNTFDLLPGGLPLLLTLAASAWAIGFLCAVFRVALSVPMLMAMPLTLLCLLVTYFVSYKI